MKVKKQNHEVIVVLAIVCTMLFSVSSVYALSKIPEENFVKKMSVTQTSFAPYSTFEEAYTNLGIQESEFLSKKINWHTTRGDISLAISDLKPVSNLSEIQKYFEDFMTSTPLFTKVKILLVGQEIPYTLSFDEAAVKAAFSPIGQGKKNAYYTWDNGLKIQDEQIGIGVDATQVESLINSYFQTFKVPETASAEFTNSDPEITKADLETYLPTAALLAAKTISLRDDKGRTWPVKLSDHTEWILPSGIESEGFATFVGNEVSPEISSEAMPVTITQDAAGAITFEGSARNGVEINLDETLSKFIDTLSGTGTTLDITTDTIKPEITVSDSLKDLGITDLVSVGYSTLRGSPANRIHNITYGLKKFNGIIIAPEEEFSFTKTLGPVDAAHGWLPELVIKGDETIPEYGGGLCQVSTTMYRAALYGGLPITARTNHSYAVSYYAYPYGYGLDATVYVPNPDMRFINDTGASILVQSYVEGSDAYYIFYGKNDGRYVNMEGPFAYGYNSTASEVTEYTDTLAPGVRQLKEYAHTGFQVDWYRTVFNIDDTIKIARETIHSFYEARPAKYLEGKAAGGA
ncbi:MAG: VanW family protein [Patescibacteria group bacterium]